MKILLYRNIFPENLASAMFSHVKTSYDKINITKKRYEYFQVPDNFSDLINSTFVTVGNITMVPVSVDRAMAENNTNNVTKLVVTYLEEKEIRSLKYGEGINVLGEEIILPLWILSPFSLGKIYLVFL